VKRVWPWLWRVAIVGLILGAGLAGWQAWRRSEAKPLEERFRLEEIGNGDVTQTVTANGTLNPVVLVNVGTQVSGTVRKLYADFNQKVAVGQVLLELDPIIFKAAVESSEGALADARAALKLAQANEQRMRELFAQEYVSRQDLDQAVQARETATAKVQQAVGQLEKDRANLGYSVIRSPVSGVVVSRQVDVGQTVAASFQTPTLFQIAQDLTRMQIDTNVAEADIGKVQVGQTVRFTVDAFPERSFLGRVRQIRLNPIVQQNVVTYNVVVEVSNPDLLLMPGMTAYISVQVSEKKNVLLVPNAALRFRPSEVDKGVRRFQGGQRPAQDGGREGGRAGTVYLARGEALAPVRIQAGISDTRYTEVLGGELHAGDKVAVEELPGQKAGGSQPFRFRAF
jgi:HlyD family secretion protein